METQAVPRSRRPRGEWLERLVDSRTDGRIRGLHVEVDEDDVVITGHAASYYAKQLATHAILEHVRDCALTNNIEVR